MDTLNLSFSKLFSQNEGTTDSEKYLVKLARKTFLSFWSYSNPYTDESKGSEFCDFMVVFGNDVILFSDKHCNFPEIEDKKIAWGRWYKSAIKKSVRQLVGASSFLMKFPNRIFLDRTCENNLPIPIPSLDNIKIHLIAVTRGSAEASMKYWGGGSSSSLMINTMIEGNNHKETPFMIGWPLDRRRFVHVLDELTLDILLSELDTTADFISYLNKKEAYLTPTNYAFIISGEEELLAYYLMNPNEDYDGFSFPAINEERALVRIDEGKWNQLSKSKPYLKWKKVNEISYEWDRLIESQASQVYQDNSPILRNDYPTFLEFHAHEMLLRAMASEGRSTRRILAEQHLLILNRKCEENRLTKTIIFPNRPERAYILMVLKDDQPQEYDVYREQRLSSLVGYCRACPLRFAGVKEVIGIASEPSNSKMLTRDFIYMQVIEDISVKSRDEEISLLKATGIWKDEWTVN
ncbi:hypothetical protein [Pantoea stewartii]|uniref:hypothetical protein n=1 Tax=Pantoea stewartii TaxID=66269 RepID=UPI000AA1E9C2|nr:hypothetical protein [Pantoea stewartii]